MTEIEQSNNFYMDKEHPFDSFEDVRIQTTEKEEQLLSSLSPQDKDRCVKTIIRLFLFKCSKCGAVTRTDIADALKEINPQYTKFTRSIMPEVQKRVNDISGFIIIQGDHIKGYDNEKSDQYYFFYNAIQKPNLRNILLTSMSQRDTAFHGFMFVVFHIIINAPSSKVKQSELVLKLNSVDSRFSSNLNVGLSASAKAPIEELGDNLKSLILRMKEEHYIQVEAIKKNDADELADSWILFGPRFYLEIGKKNLLLSYYDIIDEPPDRAIIAECCGEVADNV